MTRSQVTRVARLEMTAADRIVHDLAAKYELTDDETALRRDVWCMVRRWQAGDASAFERNQFDA